jgi:glycosyltransferase involved in cell wall biosynthesis
VDRLPQKPQGTIIWIAPFYNRSGFAVSSRTTVTALHYAGVPIRIVPVNQVEPGINDCDLGLLKSLEATPVTMPVTVIISHVPSRAWLEMKLPEPNLRILATTVFDCCAGGGALPEEMLAVCREMDQIWVSTEQEREAFLSAGFSPDSVLVIKWPHHWIDNPVLPPAKPETMEPDRPFRFLSISLFLPRRRLDTLIEAYLEEFKDTQNVELYLKVNYPSWHPILGKPREDLFNLVDALRRKTGSEAKIIIDEELGTRLDIVELIDSCNVYVSTDTAATAPIGEAIVRQRIPIMPAGLGIKLPDRQLIPVDPDATITLTPEMLQYQPNHKGLSMPLLRVEDVRSAMRRVFERPLEERRAGAALGRILRPKDTVPEIMEAISSGWLKKESSRKESLKSCPIKRVVWEGSQLVRHSLALINRELCLQLIDSGFEVSIIPYEKDDISSEMDCRFQKLVQRTYKPLADKADVHVRHQWPPNFSPPAQGRLVIIQPWEYGRIPLDWVQPMSTLVDEIWVPSRHVLKSYISSGVPADRIRVIPNGVKADLFHPCASPYPVGALKKFKFLFVGGTIWRKGVDLLLQAYCETFRRSDDVSLVIKDMGQNSFYRGQGVGDSIRRIQEEPAAPELIYLTEMMEERDMPGLFTACDCLVHPYRGEGFGLPVLEAMACGVPVITTEGGSTDDFCPPDEVFLIPSERREFIPGDTRLAGGAGWILEPDLNALKILMRQAYEKRVEAKQRALRVSERVRRDYSWQVVAGMVMERIRVLSSMPVRRNSLL